MAFQRDDYLNLNRGGTPATAGGVTGTYYVERVRNIFALSYVESSTEPAVGDRFVGLTWRNTSAAAINGVAANSQGIWSGTAWRTIPTSVGPMTYQGTWNANTNTPTIAAAAAANQGHVYIVSVAGTTAVDGVTDWDIGDWIVSNGSAWTKIDNTEPTASTTVTGNVRLATAAELAAATPTSSHTQVVGLSDLVAMMDGGRWMGDAAAP